MKKEVQENRYLTKMKIELKVTEKRIAAAMEELEDLDETLKKQSDINYRISQENDILVAK